MGSEGGTEIFSEDTLYFFVKILIILLLSLSSQFCIFGSMETQANEQFLTKELVLSLLLCMVLMQTSGNYPELKFMA